MKEIHEGDITCAMNGEHKVLHNQVVPATVWHQTNLVGNVANMLPTFCQMSVVLPNFAATYDFWDTSTNVAVTRDDFGSHLTRVK